MAFDPAVEQLLETLPSDRPLRVLVCPDRPDWAFHNIATNIIRYAPEGFDISVQFMDGPPDQNLTHLVETIMLRDIDVIHAFWREDIFQLFRPDALILIATQLGIEVDQLVGMIGARTATTSVYDHLHSSAEALRTRAAGYHFVDGYTVSSEKLNALYRAHQFLPDPDAVITDGVDVDLFSPAATPAVRDPDAPLRVGWVGNSAWGQSQGGDPKGYHRLLEPALALLERRGVAIDLRRADPQVQRIPFDQMPDFYRGLDVLVCTSASEGTPNPVLEAMASGVAIVSTDVGIVPQAFGPLQSDFILRQPDPGSLADAIEALVRDRDRLEALRTENRAHAADWSWQRRVDDWWPFWLAARRRAGDARANARRQEALLQGCSAYFSNIEATRPRRRTLVEAIRARLRGLRARR